MTFDKFDASKLISTSYDGSVRLFDIKAQKSSVIFGLPEEDSAYTTYHSQISKDCFLVSMGKTGLVGLIDTRVSNTSAASSFKVYEKASPKVVSVHPVETDLFIAPSTKGHCGIFDMRKGGSESKLMKPIKDLIGHTKAISSAMYSPVTGDRVVTVSYDNKLRIFDCTQSASILKPDKIISHNNQTGRWLTTFKAEWHPRRDDLFFIGSMQQPRQMDIYNINGEHYALKGEDLASVCSIVKCHPTLNIVVGGNSSGRVHVFKQ